MFIDTIWFSGSQIQIFFQYAGHKGWPKCFKGG